MLKDRCVGCYKLGPPSCVIDHNFDVLKNNVSILVEKGLNTIVKWLCSDWVWANWSYVEEARVFKVSVECAIIVVTSQVGNWVCHDIEMIAIKRSTLDSNKSKSC